MLIQTDVVMNPNALLRRMGDHDGIVHDIVHGTAHDTSLRRSVGDNGSGDDEGRVVGNDSRGYSVEHCFLDHFRWGLIGHQSTCALALAKLLGLLLKPWRGNIVDFSPSRCSPF